MLILRITLSNKQPVGCEVQLLANAYSRPVLSSGDLDE